MNTRIATGAMLLGVFIFLAVIDVYVINFILFAVMLTIAFLESLKLYGTDNWYGVIAAIGFFICIPFFGIEEPFSATFKIIIFYLVLIASILAFIKAKDLKILLPFIYPTAPIFLMFALYNDFGIRYFVWLILIVALSDTGAYFVGKAIGKTKFSETSPNKTLEGLFGGIIISLIGSAIYGGIYINLSFINIILITLIVAVFGVFGDLFESYLKRQADVKDSGKLLPGHGGILDRIDGYMFGAIAMFLVFAW